MIDVVAVILAVAAAVAVGARVEAIRSGGNDTAVSARKIKRSVTEREKTIKDITSGPNGIVSTITIEKTVTRKRAGNDTEIARS
jgi:hypothetical protein